MARPVLQAYARGGIDEARDLLQGVIDEIRLACLLTGSRTPEELAKKPIRVNTQLAAWIASDSELANRSRA